LISGGRLVKFYDDGRGFDRKAWQIVERLFGL
jgi:hypothetical protein